MTTEVGDYEINMRDVLGEGSFGRVFRGRHKDTGDIVAAKNVILRWHNKEYVKQEVEIMGSIRGHENILDILFSKMEEDEMWMILDYCDLGNLSDYAERHPLNLLSKLHIIHQSTGALVYLLSLKPKAVVHRDIKPENILLKETEAGPQVKICDFGIAKRVNTTSMGTKCGTDHFQAPELFDEEPDYTKAVDVFALGILILHLLRAQPRQNLERAEVRGDPVGFLLHRIHKLKVQKDTGMQLQHEKWNPVTFDLDDCEEVVRLKRLVVTMLEAEPSKRPAMETVHREIGCIIAACDGAGTSGPPSTGQSITERQLEEARHENRCIQRELNDRISQFQTQIDTENRKTKTLLEEWTCEKDNLTRQLDSIQHSYKDCLQKNHDLTAQLQLTTEKYEDARHKITSLSGQLPQTDDAIQRHKINQLEKNLEDLRQNQESIIQEKNNLAQKLQECRQNQESIIQEKSNLAQQLQESRQNQESMIQEKNNLALQLQESRQKQESIIQEKNNLALQLQESRQKQESIIQEKNNLVIQLQESGQNQESIIQDRHNLTQQLQECRQNQQCTLQKNKNLVRELLEIKQKNEAILLDKSNLERNLEIARKDQNDTKIENIFLKEQMQEIEQRHRCELCTLQTQLEKANEQSDLKSREVERSHIETESLRIKLKEIKKIHRDTLHESKNLSRESLEAKHKQDLYLEENKHLSGQLQVAKHKQKEHLEENKNLFKRLQEMKQRQKEIEDKNENMSKRLQDADNALQDLTRHLEATKQCNINSTDTHKEVITLRKSLAEKTRALAQSEETINELLDQLELKGNSTTGRLVQPFLETESQGATASTRRPPPKLIPHQVCQLNYKGHPYVGFGPEHIIVGMGYSSHLVCYCIDENISCIGRIPLSGPIGSGCYKYLTSSIIACQHENSTTEIFSLVALQHKGSYPSDHGKLCAALPGERLLYARGEGDWRGQRLQVHKQEAGSAVFTSTLTPPGGGKYSSEWISASCHPETGQLVVISERDQRMDVYSSRYKHQLTKSLSYTPRCLTSVAAVNESVIVLNAEMNKVHLHNWQGEELGSLSSQELGLPKKERVMYGIGQGPPGVLLIAAGVSGHVKSLHMFKLG